MSIVIEQTQSEMKESHALSRRASIVGVKVSSAAFSAPKAIPAELKEGLSVGVRFEPQGITLGEESVYLSTLFECVVAESPDSEELDPVAKFECSLMAMYDLQDDYTPSQAELEAFHKINVIFNCWPYFREFVQSAACRMNIPPPPVPFVRVHIVAEDPALTTSKKIRNATGKASGKKPK